MGYKSFRPLQTYFKNYCPIDLIFPGKIDKMSEKVDMLFDLFSAFT